LYKLFLGLISRLAVVVAIIGLGLYYGRLFEALLTLVAILQFELAYRQYWLDSIRGRPIFDVYDRRVVHGGGKVEAHLKVRSFGSSSAKMIVGIGGVLCNDVPLPRELWEYKVVDWPLECSELSCEGTLRIVVDEEFYEEYLNKRRCVIEVSYFTDYGKYDAFRVALYGDHLRVIKVMHVMKPPGFLLSIADYISELRVLIAQRRALRHSQR